MVQDTDFALHPVMRQAAPEDLHCVGAACLFSLVDVSLTATAELLDEEVVPDHFPDFRQPVDQSHGTTSENAEPTSLMENELHKAPAPRPPW